MISISPGNHKLGRNTTPNISLPPSKTCATMPCRFECYAMKGQCNTKTCKAAWLRNWEVWKTDPFQYFSLINRWLSTRKTPVPFFRWHVGGEVPNQRYIEGMFHVANLHPQTRFALYTKRQDLDFKGSPRNLYVRASYWPSLGILPKPGPLFGYSGSFWTLEEGEVPPEDAVSCPKYCPDCRLCWEDSTPDIYIRKH